jgi:hypothetical protein
VEVTFKKSDNGRTCSWVALRPPRSRVPGPAMAAGGDLPHDLSTFVIEATLGIDHGFWGCVADGATFRSLGRKRTTPGRAVIQRHRAELDEAEGRVNGIYFAWRRGEMTPANRELDDALTRWRRVPNGGELVFEWERTGRSRPRTRR